MICTVQRACPDDAGQRAVYPRQDVDCVKQPVHGPGVQSEWREKSNGKRIEDKRLIDAERVQQRVGGFVNQHLQHIGDRPMDQWIENESTPESERRYPVKDLLGGIVGGDHDLGGQAANLAGGLRSDFI
jgi:hypothetical protein